MDAHSKKQRSYNMSRIQSRDTKPEIIVRKLLHRYGLRFRLHRKDLHGKPDITLKKYNTVIFVNGCFWHMHDCKYGSVKPKTNIEFWEGKRIKNKERDKINFQLLRKMGWKVRTYWECEIKDKNILQKKIKRDFS